MATSALLIALQMLALPCGMPDWETDYARAMKQAEEVKKPVAVFIAKGKEGWQALSAEGKFNGTALEALRSGYVCLYLDTSEAKGKETAKLFTVGDAATLILSDRTLVYQAYRSQGPLNNEQLTQVLKRFADHEGPAPEPRRAYYEPPGGNNSIVIPCRT